ncbi:MAG: hypothetical protein HFACDABA_00117 [Anaerolineales bacterium]|nr:hypothetical protein [Anaerolineales bacterium]
MKTHLIVLEPHDDLISVRDRMAWAKTPRILLIWPISARIGLRPIDLKILQRQAQTLGARLGLVTRDRRVRREADALGLPVFKSPSAAQRDRWPAAPLPAFRERGHLNLRRMQAEVHPPEAKWKTNIVTRIFFFALGVLAALAIAAIFVPRATITFTTETKDDGATIPVVADPSLASVFITGGIPAREATREISGRQSIPATGKAAVPENEAKGVARFSNLTASAVDIPQGTIVQTLSSPPIRFVTSQAAQVPAGVGETVDVPIEGFKAGASGNLDEDSIQAVEGLLGLQISVTNIAPTTGGTESEVTAPSAGDRERLRNILFAMLRAQAQDEMLSNLPSQSVVFPSTLKEIATLEETYDPPAGETGARLTLTLRVKFSAQYASGDDLLELARLSMSAATEADFSPLADSLTFQAGGTPVTAEDGRTAFHLRVNWALARTIHVRQALSLAQGQKLETAQSRLSKTFPFANPSVTLSPSWWPLLPFVPFQIEVVIQ